LAEGDGKLAAVPTLSEELRRRQLVHGVTSPALDDLLDHGHLVAYIGFDPTASSLHLGSLLQLLNLRRLQLAGHQPVALLGGGTGLIGDPGGKEEERRLLSVEELEANAKAVRGQLERFVDTSPSAGDARALVLDNGDWLRDLRLVDFLRDVGKHFSVNQMVAKESVAARLARPDRGISFTEFAYMLLQAYDFLHLYDALRCRLQLGASDQWGNITMGVELIRRVRGAEVFGLTSPLLLKADGTKLGKTESGTVWLDPARTSPYRLYQYLVRVDDDSVGTLLRQLTLLPLEEIEALEVEVAERPERRRAQAALARWVTAYVHSEAEARRAEEIAEALYSEGLEALEAAELADALGDAPSVERTLGELRAGADLIELLVESGLSPSKSAARRALDQGGVYVNNRRRGPDEASLAERDLIGGRVAVVRRGKREVCLVRVAE